MLPRIRTTMVCFALLKNLFFDDPNDTQFVSIVNLKYPVISVIGRVLVLFGGT